MAASLVLSIKKHLKRYVYNSQERNMAEEILLFCSFLLRCLNFFLAAYVRVQIALPFDELHFFKP